MVIRLVSDFGGVGNGTEKREQEKGRVDGRKRVLGASEFSGFCVSLCIFLL
jgi:hypothetical protein